jgi:cupin-like protein
MSALRLNDRWLLDFDSYPFRFEHDLATHEDLQLGPLSEIVLSLPRDQVFASRADLRIDTDFDRAHLDHGIDRSLEAALADLATTNSYVMVRKPDAHPRLRPVLQLFVSELREHISRLQRTSPSAQLAKFGEVFHDPMLYLFISSPNSVTPFHVDRYSTLLLQLQGEKDVTIWDRHDRRTLTEEDLESLFAQPYVKNPSYKGTQTREPPVAHLRPGEGVHIPFTAPHWVKNGSEVSISVSFICKTEASLREANAYNFNYHARRLLSKVPARIPRPSIRPVGASPLVDAAKSRVVRSIFGLRRRLATAKS